MILHLLKLIELRACAGQIKLFREMFGESVDVTPELCESVADKFDFVWAARSLLSPEMWLGYERVTGAARAKYERVTGAARAKYERVTGAARAEYERVWAEYERVRGAAWAEYERVTGAAWAEYGRVKAREFGRLFSIQESKVQIERIAPQLREGAQS